MDERVPTEAFPCTFCGHALGAHAFDDDVPRCLEEIDGQRCDCPGLGDDEGAEDDPDEDEEADVSRWVKCHHEYAGKFNAFGPLRLEALGLYMALHVAVDQEGTDGIVSRETLQVASVMADGAHLEKIVTLMLERGLLVHGDMGAYVLPNYLDEQRSATQVRDDRASDANRQRRRRAKLKQQEDGGHAVTHTVTHAVSHAGDRDGDGDGDGEVKKQKQKKLPASPDGESPVESAWMGYSTAYQRRYKTQPVRNARANGLLKQFGKLVPADEAAGIAAHYVGSNQPLYVNAGHALNLLVRDAEKLRTEWVTGRTIATGPPSKTAGNLEALRRFAEREKGA